MKKITRWVELIYIFIIPLILMLLCLQFKNINTYDENNNIITSEKVLNIKELDFINTEEKTYTYINYYQPNDKIYLNDLYTDENNNKRLLIDLNSSINFNSTNDLYYMGEVEGIYKYYQSDIPLYFTLEYSTQDNDYIEEFDFSIIDYSDDGDGLEYYFYNENIDLYLNIKKYNNYYTIEFLSDVYDEIIISDCSSNLLIKSIETKTIEENAISKVLNMLYDSLGINNNIVIQLIVIYTLLWIIMFIIWHIFYLPINKLIHLFDKE